MPALIGNQIRGRIFVEIAKKNGERLIVSSFKSAIKNVLNSTQEKTQNIKNAVGNSGKTNEIAGKAKTAANSLLSNATPLDSSPYKTREPASYLSPDGAWMYGDQKIGQDANNNGIFDRDEVDQTAYDAMIAGFKDDEISILTTGKSLSGPNNWDEAAAQGYISSEDADAGKRSGQTWHDGRFGDMYKVLRGHTPGGAALEGDANELFDSELETSQGMPTAQAAALAEQSKEKDWENYFSKGMSDILTDYTTYTGRDYNPFVMISDSEYGGQTKDRLDTVAAANANIRGENVLRGFSSAYPGSSQGDIEQFGGYGGQRLIDLYEVSEDTSTRRMVHPVKDGRYRTTDDKNALYARINGDKLNGPNWLYSAAAEEDQGIISDILSPFLEGAQYFNSGLRHADDAASRFANGWFGLQEESWGGYDRDKVDSDLLLFGQHNANRPMRVDENGNKSYIFSSEEDALGEFLISNPGLTAEDVLLIPVTNKIMTETGEVLAEPNPLEHASPSDLVKELLTNDINGDNDGVIEWPTGLKTSYQFDNESNLHLYNQDGTEIKFGLSKEYGSPGDAGYGWVPVTKASSEIQTDWNTILPLASKGMEAVEYKEPGWGGQSPDLFDENGLVYKNLVTNPAQTAKFMGNMLVESSPYMLPRGLGFVNSAIDSNAAYRGYNPFEAAGGDVPAGSFLDPGLQWEDEARGNWASVTGEGATEAFFGIGARSLGRFGDKAKKASALSKTGSEAVEHAAITGRKVLPFKDTETAGVIRNIAKTAGEEGLEEILAGTINEMEKGGWYNQNSFPFVNSDFGNMGRSELRDDTGAIVRRPWGAPMYNQEESSSQRRANLAKTLADNFVLGALAGGGISSVANAPALAKAIKEDVRNKNRKSFVDERALFTEEERRAIDEE